MKHNNWTWLQKEPCRFSKTLKRMIPVLLAVTTALSPFNAKAHADITLDEVSATQTIRAYKDASPAVATIHAGNGAGAGVVVDSKCLILTNQHVLGTPEQITVSMGDQQSYSAKLIATSKNPSDDLALIQLVNYPSACSVMRMGDSNTVEVGQPVLAIGNPFGLERTLTKGIVSRIDSVKNRIQTDAAINPGNSGGPLLNARGEMIGMNQAILNPDGRSSAGIGFAIPVNVLKGFLSAYQSNDPALISQVITRKKNYFNQPVTQPYIQPYRTIPPYQHSRRLKSGNLSWNRPSPNASEPVTNEVTLKPGTDWPGNPWQSNPWVNQVKFQGLMSLITHIIRQQPGDQLETEPVGLLGMIFFGNMAAEATQDTPS